MRTTSTSMARRRLPAATPRNEPWHGRAAPRTRRPPPGPPVSMRRPSAHRFDDRHSAGRLIDSALGDADRGSQLLPGLGVMPALGQAMSKASVDPAKNRLTKSRITSRVVLARGIFALYRYVFPSAW